MMSSIRSTIKTAFFLILYPAALLRRIVTRRKDVVVLMYHSVENSDWKYGVQLDEFRKHIAHLREGYTVVPLEDVVAYVRGEINLPHKSVALTFDDGYRDTYETVFNILKRASLPFTVFLTSNLERKPQLGNFDRLTKKQIAEMYGSGLVKFEVHGRNHTHLTKGEGLSFLEDELLGCRDDIKEFTGYTSRFMAFPSGFRDAGITEYVKQAGFEAAFTINDGTVQPRCDPYAMKRVQVDRSMSMLQFTMRLTGVVDLNKAIVRFIRNRGSRQ